MHSSKHQFFKWFTTKMSSKVRGIILLILLNTILLTEMVAAKTMYALSVAVTFNKNYLKEYKVYINPGNASLDIDLEIPQTFTQDVWLNLILNLKSVGGKKSRKLFQYDTNACKLLGKGNNGFMTAWVTNFLKYGNLPKSCPFRLVSIVNYMSLEGNFNH